MHPIYSIFLFLTLYVFGLIFTLNVIDNEWTGLIVFIGIPLFSAIVTTIATVISHKFTRP